MMNVVVEDACCTVTLDGPGYESKITEYGGLPQKFPFPAFITQEARAEKLDHGRE